MDIFTICEIHVTTWQSNQFVESNVHVCSHSVLCVGKIYGHSEANARWKDHLPDFQPSNAYRFFWNGWRTNGVRVEYVPKITTLQILEQIQEKLDICQTSPETFEDRIIFMSMFNEIDWTRMSWWKMSKKVDIRYSEVSVRWIGESWRGKVEDVQISSLRNLRMQIFYFARFTQQNELSICGAEASWCEDLAELIPGQTHVSMEKSVVKANDPLNQKVGPARSGFFGTDTEEWWGSGKPLACLSSETWWIDERGPGHQSLWIRGFLRRVSIGVHYKIVHDLNDGFWFSWGSKFRNHSMDRHGSAWIGMDRWTPKLDQFFKSKLHVLLTSTESKLRSLSTSGDGSKSWGSQKIQRLKTLRGRVTLQWSRLFSKKVMKWRIV